MLGDLIVACRGVRRTPAFTVASIVTLALGIGANTLMFSIVDGVLLRPLPGYDTGRLVEICDNGRGDCRYLPPDVYVRLRDSLHSYDTISAEQRCRMNLTGRGDAEQVDGPCTTANWFELQHARAILGRTFLPGEDQRGRNKVAVLDHAWWQQRFGGDPRIVGEKLILDGEPWLVVGIMPTRFGPMDGSTANLYIPYVVEDNPHGLRATARLKSGVSLDAARAELAVAAAQLARENPDWRSLRLSSATLLEQRTGPQRPLLLLLLGAVSLVLLIACVNVGNLLLARSTARRREIEIRIALGAGRGRMLRFALAESLIICSIASGVAVALAYGGLRLLKPLTASLPRAGELSVDVRVLGWSLAIGVLAALAFAALPLRVPRLSRSHGGLIAAEVALAFVLLTGAGLLIRSFAVLRSADLGYDPREVLTHFVALPPSSDGTRDAGLQLFERIRERVAALPGVRAVATASSLPMFGVAIAMDVHPEGEPERRRDNAASLAAVSEDYFGAMRIPLRAGRAFTTHDRPGATPVAVVSQSVAARYFGAAAVGKRLLVPEFKYNIDGGPDIAVEIVGVVGNVCQAMDDCQAEHIYLAERQNGLRMANLVLRTDGDPMALAQSVRRVLAAEAPAVPLDEPQTLEQRTGYLTDAPKRAMWLLGLFAAIALLLAAAGIYGVSACLSAARSREIGIRMAVGATFSDIAAIVYRGILVPSAIGLAAGMAAAFWLMRLLKSLLFGVGLADPRTLAASALTLLAVSILAATGPALRAALTDPAKVLRPE
jgi:putative ABC transport system permease protein